MTVVAHFEYDAFGNTVADTFNNAAAFPYRFSTKPMDPTTGWYYYGYRWLDPLTGRWPSRDTIGEGGGVNLYGFVGNDGENGSDYLGKAEDKSNLSNGKFNVNMTILNGPVRWGLEGTIEFIPDPDVCPKCLSIKIIQIVKITDVGDPNGEKDHKGRYEARLGHLKTVANDGLKIEPGYFVDHKPETVELNSGARPFYRDYQSADSKDGLNDGSKPPEPSTIWDSPGGGEMVRQNFETCAVCADNGARTVLGCVKWGYTMTGTQPNPKTVALPSTSANDSSPTFKAALVLFDAAYSKKD